MTATQRIDMATADLLQHADETQAPLPIAARMIANLEEVGCITVLDANRAQVEFESDHDDAPVIDQRVRGWKHAGLRPQRTEHFGDLDATPQNGRPWYRLVPVK